MLRHDNAQLHVHRATAEKITKLHLECLPLPSYLPDLELRDCQMLGPLKKVLGDSMFRTDDEIDEVFLPESGVRVSEKRWRTFFKRGGDHAKPLLNAFPQLCSF